jgi:nicotinamidase-related amidase
MQIFHPVFWVGENGDHPVGGQTTISAEDVRSGKWRVNPAVAEDVAGGDLAYLKRHAEHYVTTLEERGKFPLLVWPYHALVTGISHALVSAVDEAVFFHTIARQSQAWFEIKGGNPLTEHYSALGPEVMHDPDGRTIGEENTTLIENLLQFDHVLIAGQAKSHCVNWTVRDLLSEIERRDAALARKFYLLEDCTSPVVVPDGPDFTRQADEAFESFAEAGMNIVRSTDPLDSWPGMAR